MTIFGLPLHPLVVHAAVVLAPLAALAALAYAVVPRWRWVLRHPVAVAAVLAAGSVQLAAMTGDGLEHSIGGSRAIQLHEMWAGRLQAACWVLAGVALLAWWALPHSSPIPHGHRSSRQIPAAEVLERASVIALPLVAVATVVLTLLTGHAGAQAVWAGTP